MNQPNDPRSLTKDEKRYLNYFWNAKTKTIRSSLPLNVITFFETEHQGKTSSPASEIELEGKFRTGLRDYVRQSGGGTLFGSSQFSLTNKGVEYIKDEHPRLVVLFERAIDRVPWLTFLFGVIGLVSSVLGIISFIKSR
jgi:hypothetical protein